MSFQTPGSAGNSSRIVVVPCPWESELFNSTREKSKNRKGMGFFALSLSLNSE